MQSKIRIKISNNQLSEQTITDMWAIYQPYYHYSEENFRGRISKNTHYALYYLSDRIVGFTGLRIQKANLEGQKFLTIYFGQTLVTDGVRGQGLINRTGLKLAVKFWRSILSRKVVFWADSLTYRAYLVFAKNLVSCFPARNQSMTTAMRQLRDFLGKTNYADRYCPAAGTVKKDSYLVRDPQMLIAENKLQDPDICYFAQANPNYETGSGLLTMGPATLENLLFMLKKALGKRKPARKVSKEPILATESRRAVASR